MREPSAAQRAVMRGAADVAGVALDRLRERLLRATGDLTGEASVEPKHDGTPVTDLDHAADQLLTERILGAFPDHGVLSEESSTRSPDTEWTWVIDPIDGTSNFACGLPYWCVSVALALDGRPVLGIVDAPVLGRRYQALLGEGSTVDRRTTSLDGRQQLERHSKLQVRDQVDWRDARNRHVPVMLTTGTARRSRDAGVRLNTRVMGSTALDLAMVADGSAVASIARTPKVWDIAAGLLLVEEAGGITVQLGDTPLLPIPPGVDHKARSVPIAAARTAEYATELGRAVL